MRPQCGLRAERTDECRVRRDKSLLLRQERDFEKSESLLFLQRKLGGAEGFEPRGGE